MKNTIPEDDLNKGIDKLSESLKGADRAGDLFIKARSGTATDEERDELIKSLGGGGGLGRRAAEAVQVSDTVAKSTLQVSDYLREMHQAVVRATEVLGDEVQKSMDDQRSFHSAMGQITLSMAQLLKSAVGEISLLKAQVAAFGAQPARAPKSQGVPGAQPAKPAERQMAGGGTGSTMNKARALQVMSDMLQKGVAAPEPLLNAIAKYESLNAITPSMIEAIQKHESTMTRAA